MGHTDGIQGAPRFSVLVPVPDHRDYLGKCLAGWCRQQTFARQRFEVLAVTDDSEPKDEQESRAVLGEPDRLLHRAGANRTELYDLAAREARGEFLVLTESHCIPEPDFLAAMDQFLASSNWDGACSRAIPICPDSLARMDQVTTEEGFRIYQQEGDWRKVQVHGFAIRRQTYLDAGGMPGRYDMFAEMILAAALRDRGCRLGYAEQAAVRHLYRGSLRDLLAFTECYVRGESLYRLDHPGPDRIGFSFLNPCWDQLSLTDRVDALRRTLGEDVLRRGLWRLDRTALSAYAQVLFRTLGGSRWPSWLAALALGWSMLRCHLARCRTDWLDRAFRAFGTASGCWSRLRFLAEQPLPISNPLEGITFPIAELTDENLVGFHGLETYQGEPFRWTGRSALLRFRPSAALRAITVETRNLRPLDRAGVGVYLNGRRVPGSEVWLDAGTISFPVHPDQVSAEGICTLILICRPLNPWWRRGADSRELGLPIFRVRGLPAAEALAKVA